jgi:hypothetical protein
MSKPQRDDRVRCRSCDRHYLRSELIRRTSKYPGYRRRTGGPTGARSETWRCCPRGHRLTRLGFRVS